MRLRRVEPVLRRALKGPCRVSEGDVVLVAVSGGADSTALLVALHSLAHEFGIEIHAAHLNHRLRGAESDADAAFVASLCKRLGVPLIAARWDTRARMRRRGWSGENGLRMLRREFLDGAADRCDAAWIATAHTADDQLETVLLRLLRGTGLRGLGGMRPRSGKRIKPLLEVTRTDIEADLTRARQPWHTDATNATPAFARNRMRNEAIPALVAVLGAAPTRDARVALARRVTAMAAELREAEAALRAWTRPLARAADAGAQGASIPVDSLRRFPPAARRELLRAVWRACAPKGIGLTAAHLAQIGSLTGSAGGPVLLPSGIVAYREGSAIRIAPGRIQGNTEATPMRFPKSLKLGNTAPGQGVGGSRRSGTRAPKRPS